MSLTMRVRAWHGLLQTVTRSDDGLGGVESPPEFYMESAPLGSRFLLCAVQ